MCPFIISMHVTMIDTFTQYILSLLRIAMGWMFLWAFLDKFFGLGFTTAASKSWLQGGSPTFGFLKFGTQGPFKPLFEQMAGNVIVDYLFMFGLLALGVALVLGIGLRAAAVGGSILLLLMWLSHLPPQNNPFLDEHIIYILVLFILSQTNAGNVLGLGEWWSHTSLVQRFPILK